MSRSLILQFSRRLLLLRPNQLFRKTSTCRRFSSLQIAQSFMALKNQEELCAEPPSRGLVLGVFSDEEDPSHGGILTPAAWKYNKTQTSGRLLELLRLSGPMPKRGEARIFFAVENITPPYYSAVAIVGLGLECLGFDKYELLDEGKEAIRRAAGIGCMELQKLRTDKIEVESFGHAESAAEGAALGIWAYQEHKNPIHRKFSVPSIDLYALPEEDCDWDGWKIGLQKAAAQNLTRQLQETPANMLTPTSFAQNVVEVLCKSGVNVEVKVAGWAESQKMNAFLAIGRASCEAPIFLELSYYGTCSDERPIVLVGQGVTYDCGGLALKKYNPDLKRMRADMTGAAVVVATCRAIAGLRLPINIRGLIPLCENVMGCNAYKPGDIYKTMSGKTCEVQGNDHDDALILADALLYAQNFCPKFIVDIGTSSRTIKYALDEAATAIYTNSEILWQQIKNSSMHTGDRVWRMPLWNYFTRKVTAAQNVDVQNYGVGLSGLPCKAAAVLREFVPCGQWMHIEASNVMFTNGIDFEYLRKGFAGRPTRTLVEFIAQTICSDTAPKVT